jgi:hypothetical protein
MEQHRMSPVWYRILEPVIRSLRAVGERRESDLILCWGLYIIQSLMRSDGRQHRVCFCAVSHGTDSDLVRGLTVQSYSHCWGQQHRVWFRAECNSTETDSVLRATAQSLIVLRATSQRQIHCWGNSTESDLSWGQQHRVGFGAEGSSTESDYVLRATAHRVWFSTEGNSSVSIHCWGQEHSVLFRAVGKKKDRADSVLREQHGVWSSAERTAHLVVWYILLYV